MIDGPNRMRRPLALAAGVAVLALAVEGGASTLTQNLSWTIDRAGTSAKYRVTAYGDSIYAGYYGSLSRAAKVSCPPNRRLG